VQLVLIADSTRRGPRRSVEFLNVEMTSAEVLAVDIKRYATAGPGTYEALVPFVIGATEAAGAVKAAEAARRRFTSPVAFFAKCTPQAQEIFQRVIACTEERGYTLYWGEVGFSVRGPIAKEGRLASFVYGYPAHELRFYFHSQALLSRDPASHLRHELEALSVFSKSGEYTLSTIVSEVGVDGQNGVYELIMHRIGAFRKVLHTARWMHVRRGTAGAALSRDASPA
jgi:hypothetical protein